MREAEDPAAELLLPGHDALLSLFAGVPYQMGVSELTSDDDLVLVSVNPAAAVVLGRPIAEVQGKRISELGLAGPGKGIWLAQYHEALRTGRSVTFEQPSGVPGADEWWMICLTHIGQGPSGHPRFAWIVQDVSERKRNERTQLALYAISEAAQSEDTVPELLARVHEIVGTLLPARNFFVALLDKASDRIHFPYHVDQYDPPPAERKLDDGTLSGRVIRLGRSLLFTPDTPNEGDHYEEKVIGAPSLDWLGVPLKTKQATIGALVVQSYDGHVRYTARDQALLEFVSGQVAAAIERRRLADDLSWQAHHDTLTGLPNRQLFQDRLGQALALAKRNGHQLAVIYMDVDRFKQINDTMGHAAGDELLCQTGQRLQSCIRSSDTLARLGGDEFTVVLTQITGSGDAMRAARKMLEAMRVPFLVGNRELFVTISLGISVFPDDGADGGTLMVNADVAMYRAKELGRDNFQWFDADMNAAANERMEMEGHLRRALELGELSLDYQPQCDSSGAVLAFEALMRWRHPLLGQVSPSRFIPLAEDSGLIVPMGEWALRQACAQAAHWQADGHPGLRVSVNVSAVQFKRPDWLDTVRRALRDTGLAPESLELEITESLLLESARESAANLFELRALGVGVAIDDFGTGYSSLSYLHKLPISTLKIDQSFVREIGEVPMHGQEDAPIIRTIIALAHNLGMTVVAEGVETEAQRRVLLSLGCEGLQGYLLHHPLGVAAASALLALRPDR
jgi:diguanylate cyclase (GGDEF)-like protein